MNKKGKQMSVDTRHIIAAEDVQKVIDGLNVEAAGSYGNGSNKSLKICTRNGKLAFKIKQRDNLIAETSDINIAVSAYNYLD
jgi:hypothetical protein